MHWRLQETRQLERLADHCRERSRRLPQVRRRITVSAQNSAPAVPAIAGRPLDAIAITANRNRVTMSAN